VDAFYAVPREGSISRENGVIGVCGECACRSGGLCGVEIQKADIYENAFTDMVVRLESSGNECGE
jgi:hypothetical protein